MRAAALLLLLGGCDQLFNLDHLPPSDPATQIDADLGKIVDAATTCPAGAFYGKYGANAAGLLNVCVPANVPPTLELPSMIDTTTNSQCDAVLVIDSYGTEACVKWAAQIHVTSVVAVGPRSLVLVATNQLQVDGLVDVSSTHAGVKGAGGNWGGCQSNDGVNGTNSLGGSGGAGGSFSSRGGDGGANSNGSKTGARTTAAADRVRGGCNGGNGGSGPGTATGGGQGRSGGSVYFIAGLQLSFAASAIVNASGAGGKGGLPAEIATYTGAGGGGGGGGSGGLIGLDAPRIQVASETKMFANGGGGGGGGDNAAAGTAGTEANAATIMTATPGGASGGTLSGKGGNGAATTGNGAVGGSLKSGGGGGGGLGYIVAFTTGPAVTTGKFSPALLAQ